jgi:hypothetical protein
LSGDGFRVEKVVYESLPNHHVTAVLYLPEGGGVGRRRTPISGSCGGKWTQSNGEVC